MTSEDNPSPDAATTSDPGAEETTITLFAPFEAQKPSRSVFQRSSQIESESSARRVEVQSKEIEFQNSEAQGSGNAKVLFRKLKAAVSGTPSSDASSSTSSSNSSSVQIIIGSSSPKGIGTTRNSSDSGSLRGHRSKGSPTPSTVNAASFVGGTGQAASSRSIMEQSVGEDPKISLTSYSDAHNRLIAKQPATSHPGGGVARPQAQAVNKSEMLKRFGSIADNKVQVSVGETTRLVVDHSFQQTVRKRLTGL